MRLCKFCEAVDVGVVLLALLTVGHLHHVRVLRGTRQRLGRATSNQKRNVVPLLPTLPLAVTLLYVRTPGKLRWLGRPA